MIDLSKIIDDIPHNIFTDYYYKAIKNNQKSIEAITISSFDHDSKEVESRMVNLKYILDNEWIFFSNYKSLKAKNFNSHNQISALFFWESINIQIRIKARIFKTKSELSNKHYKSRIVEKNALAISSMQSQKTDSYEAVTKSYNDVLKNSSKTKKRPAYWGGFSFIPYYFEFWEGHESRLNKREVYEMKSNVWKHSFLQP
jgi:pyridoxamine 5'-phosphate oxidase